MRGIEPVRMGFFNLRLQQRLNDMGISIADLAQKTGASYEHLRKLLRGDSLPSPTLLARLCVTLKLRQWEMKERVLKDRIVFRFGDSAWNYWGLTSRQGDLEMLFSVATPEQQDFMILYIKAFAEARKKMESLKTKEERIRLGAGSC